MTDELLPYFNRELTFLRKMSAEFAAAHPKIAGRLRLSGDAVEDPHVARLIEAVAFLNGRIGYKLDDDFPELTDALLGVLYPHYLAPIPSMAIVEFKPQPDLSGSAVLARGTELESEPVQQTACRFRTCAPTTLWPIEIEKVTLSGRPVAAPTNPKSGAAVAVLRVALRCMAADMTFTALQPNALRFFLRGQQSDIHALYELILNDTISVALADGIDDPNPVILGPEAIRPVGFAADEGMLPYPARSFSGYRLLTEYFAFPEKFLFIEIANLSAKVLVEAGNRMEIFLYLRRGEPELQRRVSTETLVLGCAPVVNLFRQRAEPIALTQRQYEYRVVGDARRRGATEVYSIESVRGTTPGGKDVTFRPFYSVEHGGERAGQSYWMASRRPAPSPARGTEVFLSVMDLDFDPMEAPDMVLSADTLCLNHDLPSQLPYGGGHPYMRLIEGISTVKAINCLTPPTPTLRLGDRRGYRWRLVSHLALNHLSLSDQEVGADALREILKLYDFRDSAETRALIDGVTSVKVKRGTARVPGAGSGAFCRGFDVGIEFDPRHFSGSGLFLMASILERFLGLYCSINSFTRLSATVKSRQGVLRQWPPRAGERELL